MQGFDLTKRRSIQGKQPENCLIIMPMAKCSLYDIIRTTVENVSTTASQAPIQKAFRVPKIFSQLVDQHVAQVVTFSSGIFMILWCSSPQHLGLQAQIGGLCS